jgi:uncharacterized membrane protein
MKNNYLPVIFDGHPVWHCRLYDSALAFNQVDLPDVNMSAMGSETVRAQGHGNHRRREIDLGGTVQRYQIARVELLEGDYQGIVMEMDYGRRQVLSNNIYLEVGDNVLVTIGSRPDGVLTVYFADFVRVNSILWLTAIFARPSCSSAAGRACAP